MADPWAPLIRNPRERSLQRNGGASSRRSSQPRARQLEDGPAAAAASRTRSQSRAGKARPPPVRIVSTTIYGSPAVFDDTPVAAEFASITDEQQPSFSGGYTTADGSSSTGRPAAGPAAKAAGQPPVPTISVDWEQQQQRQRQKQQQQQAEDMIPPSSPLDSFPRQLLPPPTISSILAGGSLEPLPSHFSSVQVQDDLSSKKSTVGRSGSQQASQSRRREPHPDSSGQEPILSITTTSATPPAGSDDKQAQSQQTEEFWTPIMEAPDDRSVYQPSNSLPVDNGAYLHAADRYQAVPVSHYGEQYHIRQDQLDHYDYQNSHSHLHSSLTSSGADGGMEDVDDASSVASIIDAGSPTVRSRARLTPSAGNTPGLTPASGVTSRATSSVSGAYVDKGSDARPHSTTQRGTAEMDPDEDAFVRQTSHPGLGPNGQFRPSRLYDIVLALNSEPVLESWWTNLVSWLQQEFRAERISLALPEEKGWSLQAVYENLQTPLEYWSDEPESTKPLGGSVHQSRPQSRQSLPSRVSVTSNGSRGQGSHSPSIQTGSNRSNWYGFMSNGSYVSGEDYVHVPAGVAAIFPEAQPLERFQSPLLDPKIVSRMVDIGDVVCVTRHWFHQPEQQSRAAVYLQEQHIKPDVSGGSHQSPSNGSLALSVDGTPSGSLSAELHSNGSNSALGIGIEPFSPYSHSQASYGAGGAYRSRGRSNKTASIIHVPLVHPLLSGIHPSASADHTGQPVPTSIALRKAPIAILSLWLPGAPYSAQMADSLRLLGPHLATSLTNSSQYSVPMSPLADESTASSSLPSGRMAASISSDSLSRRYPYDGRYLPSHSGHDVHEQNGTVTSTSRSPDKPSVPRGRLDPTTPRSLMFALSDTDSASQEATTTLQQEDRTRSSIPSPLVTIHESSRNEDADVEAEEQPSVPLLSSLPNEVICAVQIIPNVAFCLKKKVGLTACNSKWTEFTQQSEAVASRLGFLERVHEDDRAAILSFLELEELTDANPASKGPSGTSASSNVDDPSTNEIRILAWNDEYRYFSVQLTGVGAQDKTESEADDCTDWLAICTDIHAYKAMAIAKTRFLSNMSHEMRTPLHGITGTVNLFLAEHDNLTDDQLQTLEVIRKCTSNLRRLVDDILDYAHVEAGKVSLKAEPFRVRDVLEDTVEMVLAAGPGKGVELSYYYDDDVPTFVEGDRHRLGQILLNTVGNAFKFTSEGEVGINCSVCPDPKGSQAEPGSVLLRFDVTDTGIGFNDTEARLLFKRFSQLPPITDSPSRQTFSSTNHTRSGTAGNGLGLAISRHLAQLHGGDMWAEGEPGKGAVFTVTMRFGVPNSPVPGEGGDTFVGRFKQPLFDLSKDVLVACPLVFARASLKKHIERVLTLGDASGKVCEAASVTDMLSALKGDSSGQFSSVVAAAFDNKILAQIVLLHSFNVETAPETALDKLRETASNSSSFTPRASAPVLLIVTSPEQSLLVSSLPRALTSKIRLLSKPVRPAAIRSVIFPTHSRTVSFSHSPPRTAAEGVRADIAELRSRLGFRDVKILMLEDDPTSSTILKRYLHQAGIELVVALDGEAGIRKIMAQPRRHYTAVLCDLHMPIKDGFEACAAIRDWEKNAAGTETETVEGEIPVIALSANVLDNVLGRCREAGFTSYLTKPLNFRQLNSVLFALLSPDEKDDSSEVVLFQSKNGTRPVE